MMGLPSNGMNGYVDTDFDMIFEWNNTWKYSIHSNRSHSVSNSVPHHIKPNLSVKGRKKEAFTCYWPPHTVNREKVKIFKMQ